MCDDKGDVYLETEKQLAMFKISDVHTEQQPKGI